MKERGVRRTKGDAGESLSGALSPVASPSSNGSQPYDCPVEYVDPERLTPHPLNWTQHPEHQREAIRASIEEHGWLVPLVVNRASGYCLDGHGRRDIALEMGLDRVPVRYVDEDEEGEKRILARLNRTAALAEPHDEALAALLSDLAATEAGLPAGWAQSDLDQLLRDLGKAGGLLPDADPDASPSPGEVEQRCQPGDIWVLGEHRIGCLDCRDPAAIERLIGSDVPQMVFADPPYGIDVVTVSGVLSGRDSANSLLRPRLGTANGSKPFGKVAGGTAGKTKMIESGVYAPVIGDESSATALDAHALLASLWPQAVHVWWGANHYANGLPASSCWLVWDKENTGNFADAELAWTNQKSAVRLFRHMWNGLMKDSERGEKRVHPTQKPVALAEWCFEKYGAPGDVVFDPFLGSGPTIIAAEKIGRRLIGAELSPDYVNVCLARWESCTGKTAERLDA